MHSTPIIRRLALMTVTALVAGTAAIGSAATAQAAATVQVQASGIVSLSSGPVTADFPVTIGGTATTYQATVQAIKTVGAKSALPTVASAPPLTLGQPVAVTLSFPNTTAPGRYQLTIQALDGTAVVGTASASFDVNASLLSTASLLKTGTIYYHLGKAKLKIVWAGPLYLKGAKITFYYQKPGKTSFTKIGSKKINAKGKATFKTKKVKVVRGVAYKLKLSSRPYAPGWVLPGTLGNS